MERIALFPGTFDPFTKGHFDVVERGLKMFDKVIIGLGNNSQKLRYFPIEMMQDKIREAFKGNSKVEVAQFDNLAADFARENGAQFILRGLRNTTDFEYENTISQINRRLNTELETVFLITSPKYAAISSSIIREIHKYGQNVNEYLPYSL